jgi:hypothetical protein
VTVWAWFAIAAAVIAVIVGIVGGYVLAVNAPGEPRRGLDSMGLPPPHPVGWCSGCGVLQRVDATGRIADHDRPEPSVPFDTAPVHCEGSGRTA